MKWNSLVEREKDDRDLYSYVFVCVLPREH